MVSTDGNKDNIYWWTYECYKDCHDSMLIVNTLIISLYNILLTIHSVYNPLKIQVIKKYNEVKKEF